MVDFLIKEIAAVVVSAEEDATKTKKLAVSIQKGGVFLEGIFNLVQSSKNEPNQCPSTQGVHWYLFQLSQPKIKVKEQWFG